MLVAELEEVGIRLNASKPDVVFKQKTAGGVSPRLRAALTHKITVRSSSDIKY